MIAPTSHALAANVENLTISNGGAFSGTGNVLDNTITGNNASNLISGLAGEDLLFGRGGADTLLGGDDVDRLYGQDGNDVLSGGLGNDVLCGGAGQDIFHLAAPLGWDNITDFTPGQDRIEILRSSFGNALPAGALDASAFRADAVATTSGAQFLYNTSTGWLRWDADGAGGSPATLVAVLSGAPAISAADIVIVNAMGSALPTDTLIG